MPKLDGQPVAAKLSPETTRQMMCDGKQRFTRHRIALRCAQRAGRREKIKMSVYLCRFCHGYHVGSDHKKPKRFETNTPEEDQEWVRVENLNRLRSRK